MLAISESECDKNWRDHNEECVTLWTDLRNKASQKAASLQNDLTIIRNKIKITTVLIFQTEKQIVQLEKEIADLESKIGRLDLSLDKLSEILAERIAETYKRGKIDFVSLFLSSQNFSEFVSRFKYLRVVQLHDRSLMVQMETTRTNFEDQKTLKEEKQEELAVLKKKS